MDIREHNWQTRLLPLKPLKARDDVRLALFHGIQNVLDGTPEEVLDNGGMVDPHVEHQIARALFDLNGRIDSEKVGRYLKQFNDPDSWIEPKD